MRAVIFDMDGVIVDSEPHHARACRDVVREIGYGENHGVKFADFVGRPDQDFWLEFIARHQPPHSLEQLMERKRRRVMESLQRERPIFSGLFELVQKLSARYPLALASGSEREVVGTVLGWANLGPYFRAVVTATEVARGKPEPEIFLRTAELLGHAPEDCWVIEDSKPGITAGRAAGMAVIAITNTHPVEELSGADHIVQTYEEIADLLL